MFTPKYRRWCAALLFASASLAAQQRALTPGAPVPARVQPSHSESITVTADASQADLLAPDPSEKVYLSEDLLQANPGRPGVPVSLPGYPAETASGGIKAPQYFAPGVAGDHGEPIAQYIAVGGFLVSNNLSANAHGNGYADPNILIPAAIESVAVDGGAYNVLEGNHAVNLAATYGLQGELAPYATLILDPHDADLSAGFALRREAWIALEASFGNGLLHRLEHRQQYKLNAQRVWRTERHTVTLLAIAYFGRSALAGLVPLYGPEYAADRSADTIDPRQQDQTHTGLLAASDTWRLTARQQLNVGGYFRTYSLSLYSNFGDGLIRQSEFRTAQGGSAAWRAQLGAAVQLLAGLDVNREAPRRDNLDSYGAYTGSSALGAFEKVDSSNVTLTSVTPYAAVAGSLGRMVQYYAGWRRDQIDFVNDDLMHAENSFSRWAGVNSPKATLSFVPRASGRTHWLPEFSGSAGEAFFTEDPRTGSGIPASPVVPSQSTLVARSHAYQVVASKSIADTEVKLTVGQTTSSSELAKIDPDTGLEEDQGPTRMRFVTATVRKAFRPGWVLLTFSKADARGLDDGLPTPEAPRLIADAIGGIDRMPWGLHLQGEFEYVGAKPLGTGCAQGPAVECVGVPLRELRFGLTRSFLANRLLAGVQGMAATGYSGQTTEQLVDSPLQQIVGVRQPSYVSLDLRWRLDR